MASPDLIESARASLVDATSLAERDLARIWAGLDLSDASGVADALVQILPDLGEVYGDVAGTVAADLYDNLRDDAGVSGAFAAEPAPLPGTARYESLARWGIGPLFGASPDGALALSLISGGMQRVVANAHRDTVALSTKRDPASAVWSRHARSNACAFCKMLAGRNDVYGSSDSALSVGTGRIRGSRKQGEKYHDSCHCLAVPSWS